jgi:hypothetical protein
MSRRLTHVPETLTTSSSEYGTKQEGIIIGDVISVESRTLRLLSMKPSLDREEYGRENSEAAHERPTHDSDVE